MRGLSTPSTLSQSGGRQLSSSYPQWLEDLVRDTENELLYEAYEILDKTLPKGQKVKVLQLKDVFGIDETALKRAGFFLEDEYEREELIRELLERSNYYRFF